MRECSLFKASILESGTQAGVCGQATVPGVDGQLYVSATHTHTHTHMLVFMVYGDSP